jgi:hypothetical protein
LGKLSLKRILRKEEKKGGTGEGTGQVFSFCYKIYFSGEDFEQRFKKNNS